MPDPRNIFKSRYKKQTRTYSYGKVPGIEVGTILKSRKECSDLGLHGPTQAGIHGNAVHGAYSVVLSGGYEDDEDNGESFWYTGEGGRKDGGGPQVEDQSWKNKNNKSLKNSCGLDKQLIRVIRGHTLQSPYAPSHGYRYDGLYRVTQAKQVRGKSGYLLCKFFFQRKPNQPPLPEPTSITRSEKLKQNIPSHYSASSSDSEDEAPTMVIESTSKRTDTPDSQSTRVHTPLASTSKTRIPETEFIEVEDSADDDNLFSGADSEKESEQEEQEASDEVPSSSHQPPSPSLVALGKRKRFLTPISISSDEEDFPLKPPKRKKRGVVLLVLRENHPLVPGGHFLCLLYQ
ncbi:hypothetical protein BT96DRAFT_602631 [Gymnopus androsaceus JB14]|uniref:YDG domain-containing protein n=1 Tax=Gymnopus androsaceus JB14 TaxID=1447944 RepID=A0A6A4HY13_9AGAR|nr:hypothetical protein BT96DRAFT_602631 [Gymnopus androsaceus JB14]